jgi:23S rRNA (pseudouridine1915-N3)-methyltransferase
LLKALRADDWVVALDEGGSTCDTQALADKLADWRMEGRDIAMLVGGADGLPAVCLERADETLSLSKLTFPHELVRVIVAEQIYRAWTILAGHPYHRV